MEPFHHRSNQLFCEDVPLPLVAERFGTPTYVYSERGIIEKFRRLQRQLSSLPSLVCYSAKANSNLSVLNLLRKAGAGFDVVSGGELARVLRVGAKPQNVVFSGVGKSEAEVDAGIRARIRMFNVESAQELELIRCRARTLGKRAPVSIRINPDVAAETHPYIATGEVAHKFGVPKHEAVDLIRRAASSKELHLRGVACHIGSQILKVEPFLKALDEIWDVAEKLRTEGIGLEDLDLGGGYGIRYADEPEFDFDSLIEHISKRVRGTPYCLILEPGRALVGEAGVLLTRVLYVKQNQQKNFVVVDAGMNDLLRPALYGSNHQILPVVDREREKWRADVVGPLCESGDFLARDRDLPQVRPGELLAVLTVGAYGYVLASNYNSRPRPAEVLVRGRRVELIRPRERVEDLMAGEEKMLRQVRRRRTAPARKSK